MLNACWTSLQALSIRDAVGCVIGMSAAVGDTAARTFAESFYSAIGYGQSCDAAFALGRNSMNLANISDADKPKLLTRNDVDPSKLTFV